jgi:hypothetical protein
MESETKSVQGKETSPAMAAPALAVTAAPGGHYVGTSSLEYLSMSKGRKSPIGFLISSPVCPAIFGIFSKRFRYGFGG